MRPPFFRSGGRIFVDLLWNFDDEPIVPTSEQFDQLVAAVPAAQIIVARELSPSEAARLRDARHDSDQETFAGVVTTDAARWGPPTKRRRR